MTENLENNLYFFRHPERSRHAAQSKDLSCPTGSFDCGLRPPLRMTVFYLNAPSPTEAETSVILFNVHNRQKFLLCIQSKVFQKALTRF